MNNTRLSELVDETDLKSVAEKHAGSIPAPRTIVKYYGPYERKEDKRLHMVVFYSDGTRGSQSYPRYLMEKKLGRQLEEWETVDHKDDNEANNDLNNLQIITLFENIEKHHRLFPRSMHSFICPNCNEKAMKPLNFVLNNKKRGKNGPFCSRSCAGQFQHKNNSLFKNAS